MRTLQVVVLSVSIVMLAGCSNRMIEEDTTSSESAMPYPASSNVEENIPSIIGTEKVESSLVQESKITEGSSKADDTSSESVSSLAIDAPIASRDQQEVNKEEEIILSEGSVVPPVPVAKDGEIVLSKVATGRMPKIAIITEEDTISKIITITDSLQPTQNDLPPSTGGESIDIKMIVNGAEKNYTFLPNGYAKDLDDISIWYQADSNAYDYMEQITG